MIVPDTKDWTWVLRTPCPQCGFDAAAVVPAEVAARLRANAEAWRQVLVAGDVGIRPRPDRWSSLEYACHVRDVCRIYDERLVRMLTEDEPEFPDWDQDATAIEARYDQQNPADVAAELATAADTLAARFAEVSGGQWNRKGSRSDGAHFTVATFAQYFIHDLIHHLNDVTGAPASRV
ncbi:DinB family protein [Saccharomonospora sp. NPDC006951]